MEKDYYVKCFDEKVGGFPLITAMNLAGLLFLLILGLWLAMKAFGMHQVSDYDSDAELRKININPKKWQISIGLALISHVCVISLAILLFHAFGDYNLILGVALLTFRLGEGLILIYHEKDYWGLLNIAKQYSGTSGAEKNSLNDLTRTILKTKDYRFRFTQVLWALGTLALSIVLVTSGEVPHLGWIGIVASIFFGFGNGLILVKPNFEGFAALFLFIGGLSAMVFEVIFGVWLLFS